MMTNKVYTGTTSIEEHIKQLDMPDWKTRAERKAAQQHRPPLIIFDDPTPERKQSIEIQQLKREAGLRDD